MANAENLRPGENPYADSSVRPEALPGEPPIKGDYQQHHDEEHGHHIVPLSTYYKVFGSLMVLLIITVLAAEVDMAHYGVAWMNIIIALVIAAMKAVLIVLFFMHVKFSSRLVWIFSSVAYFFLMVMFAMSYGDYFSRHLLPAP